MSVVTVRKPQMEQFIVLPKPLSRHAHHYCTSCRKHYLVVSIIEALSRNELCKFDYCPFCGMSGAKP